MASDHQTQAGKPQPLNPKVGTMGGGCEEQAKLIPQTQFLFCKVGMAFAFLGLPHSTPAPLWASLSPICMLGADSDGPSPAHNWHARDPSSSFPLWRLKFLCLTHHPTPYGP